ncbi:hypothetical protein SAMN04487943_1149 [Gracilibacillus orientalis]|uniref:Uncharacterized protein n=1 Tax=Gracilibacillus orientalis TaxID=334253 RepID=A0A1I4Q0Y1_9BACI|nr:hypothetical protein [Gracilibacillus orientalis]SFM33654.1 hypothetical protein SAMN04487943_1149 [Gracilibacillus orientalis]
MIVSLAIISIIIALISFLYTWKVGKIVDEQNGEHDTDTKATAKHPILFNPIFLTYIFGFGGLILFIFYLGSKYY